MKVYKQEIPFWTNRVFEIEIDGEILTFELQHSNIVAYYNPNATVSKYSIALIETGYDLYLDSDYEYVKTLMMFNGDYVLHCYIKQIIE